MKNMASQKKRGWKKVLIPSFIIALILGIWGLVYFIQLIQSLPHPEKITDLQPTQSTKIYDRTGQVLLYEIHGAENRTVVASKDIPDYMKKAVIAIEDQGFYEHSALDWKGIIRAFFTNIVRGKFSQGASTITQQLVKTVFLTPEKTIKRKLSEWILSYWIENNYTKDEILDYYLNQIPFGSNAYGIQAASHLYFGKDAKDLTLAESATLAAMIQSPTYYSPWGKHLDEMLSRKNYVLEQMKSLGYIDAQQLTEAENQKLVFQPQSIGSIKAPHFVMKVRDDLINKYGEDLVENGGLKVITTLDYPTQQAAEKSIEEGAARNKELYKSNNASLFAMDPKTGQVLALVGSADYFDNSIDGNFNVATQGLRQPGSSFKPFVYLTALEEGYTPDTVVFDTPTEFVPNNPNCPIVPNYNQSNTQCFHPQNFDLLFRGPVTMKQALSQSLNVPSVKFLYLAGIPQSIDTAQKMGITTLNDPSSYGLSLVLGGGAVKLADLVGAYTVFSQDGIKHQTSYILSVQNNKGEVLDQYADNAVQVEEPEYIRTINSILSDVNLRASLFQSSLPLTQFDGYQVALKTGTTNDYRDAWAVGYTPFITVGVWAGNSDYSPMQRHGGSILAAVPIWSSFLKQVINKYPPETFPVPDPITSSKPMLNGQYINAINENGAYTQQVHDILYYVDKNHPLDNFSSPNPGNDSQFNNWEVPAITWAINNIPNFSLIYNK
jgi:1A family penicillin-binding protein